MRAPTRVVLALTLLGSVSCASPLAVAPLAGAAAQAALAPSALAAPLDDGSVYVLAEGTRLTSPVTLKSLWKRKASEACDGDYMVMSERDSHSTRGGVIAGRSYEGFIRCVSPEGMKPE